MSLLSIPRSGSGNKRNSTRLDLLSLMISSPDAQPPMSDSPRDLLSPISEPEKKDIQERGRTLSRKALDLSRHAVSHGEHAEAGTRDAQAKSNPEHAFHELGDQHEVATLPESTNACPPRRSPLINRTNRPSDLKLKRSNGLTLLPTDQLKHQISNGHTDACAAIIEQVSQRRTKQPQRSPSPKMGNQTSSVSEPLAADDASMRSVVRKPVRMLRKSSHNLFKRMDSKSPLPRELTIGTVLQVTQQVSQSTLDGQNGKQNDESPIDPFPDINAASSKSPPPDDIREGVHTASAMTITEESAMRPLSASTTIRDSVIESRIGSRAETRTSFVENVDDVHTDHQRCTTAPPANRGLTLSPSIPAPSPLPKDSPHKYGLKDRMDTPEIPEPEKIDVTKLRRQSTGVDIFNEAKSLQSASSFLNGLSVSRRRAESNTNRSTETSTWTHASRPASSSRPSSRPQSTAPTSNLSERHRGHTFKSSGFVYTLPLTLAQLRCYRDHNRLLSSRNKKAPVECAVCHIDDEQEHFSCSWCALRMCRFCRRDFAERGMAALRERIRLAELGDGGGSDSTGGSGEDGRGRKMFASC